MSDNHQKVHLWIGTNFQSEDEYLEYFKLDYSVEGDFDDPAYKLCGFCRDIGTKWYDEDFIGIIHRRTQEVSLSEILEEAAIDSSEKASVVAQCLKLGVNKANSMFWYADSNLAIKKPIKNEYNGLKYIGLYDGD